MAERLFLGRCPVADLHRDERYAQFMADGSLEKHPVLERLAMSCGSVLLGFTVAVLLVVSGIPWHIADLVALPVILGSWYGLRALKLRNHSGNGD